MNALLISAVRVTMYDSKWNQCIRLAPLPRKLLYILRIQTQETQYHFIAVVPLIPKSVFSIARFLSICMSRICTIVDVKSGKRGRCVERGGCRGNLSSLIHSMTMCFLDSLRQVRAESSCANMADNLDSAIVQPCATWEHKYISKCTSLW
jgi:hypothetical protein